MITVVVHPDARAFLERAGGWLERAEDRHNLVLSIAHALRDGGVDALFLTVERGADVAGCAIRTPPHKLLVTALPHAAAVPLVEALGPGACELPGVLGPEESARDVALAWAGRFGGAAAAGMENGIYRVDEVIDPVGVAGRMRAAAASDVSLATAWGHAFGEDTGMSMDDPEAQARLWISSGRLFVWEDGGPVSMAVAHGHTRRGARIGYVYTPPEARGRGYASALVAALTRRELDGGRDFCVLYTDLANPTSNRIYQRVGYVPIARARDFVFVRPEEETS